MKRYLFIVLSLLFLPAVSLAFTASDFTVNSQSTYAVPYNASDILVLDMTLPDPAENKTLQLASINLHSLGTADHTDFIKLTVWEDGAAPGWNNDERSVITLSSQPFFDTELSGNFREYSKGDPQQRIFVTVDTKSSGYTEETIKLQFPINSITFTTSSLFGPTDAEIAGPERGLTSSGSLLSTPSIPIAGMPEVISQNTIRWHFTDTASNEFGFKLLDGELNLLMQKDEANLSYIDETGLQPGTTYAGRKIIAFNDRGESPVSVSSLFPSATTLAEEKTTPVEEVVEETELIEEPAGDVVEEETIEPLSWLEEMEMKIIGIQSTIFNLFKEINNLIFQQTASIWTALQGFVSSFFEQ